MHVWAESFARLLRDEGTARAIREKREASSPIHQRPWYITPLSSRSSLFVRQPAMPLRLRIIRPLGIERDETAHGPGLAGARVCRSCVKEILHPAGIGTGYYAPTRAIPLFDEGLKGAGGIINEVPHSPDVSGGDDGDSIEDVGYGAGICWMGDDAPTAAVPLFDQCPTAAVSHGPDVAAGDRRYGSQVSTGGDAGAGDGAPTRAVPVQSECLKEIGAGDCFDVSHSPDIIGGDGGHS